MDRRGRINADAIVGTIYMTSYTAPGDVGKEFDLGEGEKVFLPSLTEWWNELDAQAPGLCGCTERRRCKSCDVLQWQEIGRQRGAQAAWDASMSKRWSKMHRAASEATRRRYGPGALLVLEHVKERHARGPLHGHVAFEASRPEVANFYARKLSRLAPAYGFGFVDRGKRLKGYGKNAPRVLQPMKGQHAAGYLAKYLRKGTKDPAGLARVQEQLRQGRRREGGNILYVGRTLTMKTGCTARWLRWRRIASVGAFCPYTGEILGPSLVRDEWMASKAGLPRPPPADEVGRALRWDQREAILRDEFTRALELPLDPYGVTVLS